MNLLSIISRIGDLNFEQTVRQSGSEKLFNSNNTATSSKKAAFATTAGVGTGRTAAITDVLNFALKLEYLESSFYNQGVSSGVISAADLAIFQQIRKHENAHVQVLQDTITALGGTPDTTPTFDFTAGGAFDPFNQYGDFLALSQAFEDTGVRAYKGQAANLISNNDVLTAALQIHSVEARHASEVRRLRRKNGMDMMSKGWITGSNRGTLPSATQAIYDGEQNVMQGGVDVTTITTASASSIQEAFDEPLSDTDVIAIASLFIV